MLNKLLKLILFLTLFPALGISQTNGKFSFLKSSLPVYDSVGNLMTSPFAGGMNNCMYGEIDLNNDGVKDLVVFDRHGNRILPFINQNVPNTIKYTFHPEYSAGFPLIEQWMQLIDYDKDDKEDIFTYTTGGIKVYHNESAGSLKFRQVTNPYLTSLQGTTQTNILVTNADFPAIADIDGDGDLDILTFWGLGSFVEYHKNLSLEQSGKPGLGPFEKESGCWGRFAEGAESNSIKLDTCPPGVKRYGNIRSETKHTGSTLLVKDFSKDGLPDIVIGDVDFPGVVQLINGGTPATAQMVSQTTNFPNMVNAVNVTSFPSVCMVDVNNDGKQDLLVSPFDPGLTRSESSHSSILYLDKGTGNVPDYRFNTNQFLQSEMIDLGSGAYPVLFDYNMDGLPDLVIGNFGVLDSAWIDPSYGLKCRYHSSLALMQNIGTIHNPSFKMITKDFGGLSSLKMQGLYPAFADLDGDGDIDMVCGNSNGQLLYFENTATSGQPATFTLRSFTYQGINVGAFSAPQFIDIDGDGMSDLVCGRRDGFLSYYHNTGTVNNPVFSHVNDKMGNVRVTDTTLSIYGYSTPFFFRDNSNKLKLFVGSEYGNVYYYSDIENNVTGKFTATGTLTNVKEGWRTGVAVAYLNSTNFPDLIVGNYSGGLGYFKGIEPGTQTVSTTASLLLMPNPSIDFTDIQLINMDGWVIESVELTDILGKQVESMTNSGGDTATVPIDKLSSGVYILRVKAKNLTSGNIRLLSGKIVKIR